MVNKNDKPETKLTTVKIIKGLYASFKSISFHSDITLQKVVNRSLHKYVNDEDYRSTINEYTELEASGSQY